MRSHLEDKKIKRNQSISVELEPTLRRGLQKFFLLSSRQVRWVYDPARRWAAAVRVLTALMGRLTPPSSQLASDPQTVMESDADQTVWISVDTSVKLLIAHFF